MCRSLNRRRRTNPAGRYVAECRKVGNNRPKSRGRDRRPQGRVWRSGCGPGAGPRRNKPRQRENGETTFGAVDRGPVRANNRKPGDLTGRLPAPRTARSGDPGIVGADVLLAMAGMGARQGTEPPGAAGFLRRFLGPYYHLESIRSTTVAIGWGIEQHSRTGFDSASMFLEN